MSVRLYIRSGGRAGQTVSADKRYVSIGRHPHSDIRFSSPLDAGVSSRHAAIVCRDRSYYLRDLCSPNGTFVNGRRVLNEHLLAEGDVIQFGDPGPRAEVTFVPLQLSLVMEPVPVAPPVAMRAAREPRLRPTPAGGLTAAAVELVGQRRVSALRRRAAAAGLVLATLAGGVLWLRGRGESARTAQSGEQQALRLGVDSLRSGMQALRSALDSSDAETARLRRTLRNSGTRRDVAVLRRRLRDAVERQQQISSAAALDLAAIARANRGAVAVVIARAADSTAFSGTAFVVRSVGGSALLVTNRHVLRGGHAGRPVRVSVVLDGTARELPAEIVALHPTADLALLRVATEDAVPVVHGLAGDSLPADGAPVGMIGFPLGLDLAMGGNWHGVGVTATTVAGTVSRTLPTLLQLDGYGAQGGSGSPIFDARGQVVAVLYGSEPESGGRILYSVPVRQVHELLRDAPTAP